MLQTCSAIKQDGFTQAYLDDRGRTFDIDNLSMSLKTKSLFWKDNVPSDTLMGIRIRRATRVMGTNIFNLQGSRRHKKAPNSPSTTQKGKHWPENIYSEEDCWVHAGVGDNLWLGHLKGPGHPVEEREVSEGVEVDEAANEVGITAGTGSWFCNVPLGEVNAVIEGLDPEEGKG